MNGCVCVSCATRFHPMPCCMDQPYFSDFTSFLLRRDPSFFLCVLFILFWSPIIFFLCVCCRPSYFFSLPCFISVFSETTSYGKQYLDAKSIYFVTMPPDLLVFAALCGYLVCQ